MNYQDSDKQLDYHGLIIAHLSRLSYVTTSNFIDVVNPVLEQKFVNPLTAGETALGWGVAFLYSIVPDGLIDKTFEKEKLDDGLKGAAHDFAKLRLMINLLHRKGLLIQTKVIGRSSKKEVPDDKISQEWEE